MSYAFIISLITYLLLVTPVNSVTTALSNTPELISSEPFTIKVTVSGANAGTNYLKIDLYKPSTSNYFGETFNGLGWYSESDPTQYHSVNIETGIDWSGEIQGKIGNPSLTQYGDPEMYKLRVRRYTSSGNYNSTEANNSAVDINIDTMLSTPTPNPTPFNTPRPTEASEQLISPTYNLQPETYKNVYISEVMVDPETGNNEWIEIYNANDFEVVLDHWHIDDLENAGSTPKEFSLTVPAKNYNSFDLSGSIFNNSGDNVRLLDFNQKEIDNFQYESSEKGKTLGRTSFDNDSFCLQAPTKNNPNSSCLNPTTASTSKSTSTLTPTNTLTKTPSLTTIISRSHSTITPIKFSLFNQNQPIISDSPEEIDNEVLGISTENQAANYGQLQALLSSLTSASFSYSVLAIISIFYKVKNNS